MKGWPRLPSSCLRQVWKQFAIVVGGILLALLAAANLPGPSARPAGVGASAVTPGASANAPDQIPHLLRRYAQTAVPSLPSDAAPIRATRAPVVVPNVVGLDLRTAEGVLFPSLLPSAIDDPAWRGRRTVGSRWVVVTQRPVAGSQVPALTTIDLYVVEARESD